MISLFSRNCEHGACLQHRDKIENIREVRLQKVKFVGVHVIKGRHGTTVGGGGRGGGGGGWRTYCTQLPRAVNFSNWVGQNGGQGLIIAKGEKVERGRRQIGKGGVSGEGRVEHSVLVGGLW